MPGSFFDTNVLICLCSSDTVKSDRAEELVRNGGTISVQVLNEFANVARRKMRMTWRETQDALLLLRGLLTVQPVTIETHKIGVAFAERHTLSVYDAMIAASASECRCDTLWSEDMQDGMVLDGRLQIVNPFRVGT